jgi:ankyrin repeat protein
MIVRLAAVIVLALSIAGTSTSVIGGGHPPSEPLDSDWDRDGLCSDCETEIFGTDPRLADTDDNGTLDGDEDHDQDGISNIVELNKMATLMYALENGDVKTVEELLEYSPYIPIIDNTSMTPLQLAAYYGPKETVRVLLDAGADVNIKYIKRQPELGSLVGWTALMFAASNGQIEIVEILLESGADVHAADRKGYTSLVYAAESGHIEVVEILLQAGAYVNAAQDAALKWAAFHGYTKIVRLLIMKGADVNAQDIYGWTALMYAAYMGSADTVELLLQSGADVNYRNKDLKTALLLAEEKRHTEIIKLLKDTGAKE